MLLEPSRDFIEWRRREHDAMRAPLDAAGEQTRVLKHPQVLGDRGERHVERIREFAHGRGGTGQTFEDRATGGVGEGGERGVE